MSRFRLAFVLGFDVRPESIMRYETETNLPSVETVAKIANALGIRIDALMRNDDAES